MNYLGIDGGGTKTLFRLVDENLNTIREVELGTAHFGQVGYDGMEVILRKGIEKSLDGIEEDTLISFGLAGYGEVVAIREKIEETVKKVVGKHKYVLHNDAQIAAFGALGGVDGIVMIAGTGSIAVATKDGKWHRRGGYGYLIDDGGSAYDIGKQALKVFARMAEDIIEKDALYDVFMDNFKLDKPSDLIKVMFDCSDDIRNATASLSGLVYTAICKDSKAAKDIFANAALQHSIFIKSLQNIFDINPPVSYIGGVYRAENYILEPLKGLGIEMQKPVNDSCHGAILLGKKVYNG